jgi:hypothetical protein
MEDPDGDGIFEKELIFNVYDPSAHTSSPGTDQRYLKVPGI